MAHRLGSERDRGLLAALFSPALEALLPMIEHERAEEPFQRDPAFIERLMPLLEAITCYFGAEVRGWEHLPAEGPYLVVGNHSGGAQPPDLWPFFVRWVHERGADDPFYTLTYDLDFAAPYIGPRLRRLGLIPASRDNARRAFAMGAPALVFPGGDYEVFRPWYERNRIEFGGRTGFISLALSAGVPVVPMTIHGAHESTVVITRGHRFARWAGLDRLHIQVFPLIWNIPLGITPAFVPTIQLPAKVTVEIGEPLDWPGRYHPTSADDPEVVTACYEEITAIMQDTLDALAVEDPFPILTRLGELRPDRCIVSAFGRLVSGKPARGRKKRRSSHARRRGPAAGRRRR